MACITLAAPMAMATTQLARAAHYEHIRVGRLEINVERTPLRMSWVVVTDSAGNRKLKMLWTPSAEID